jgi:SAM-dependent methyltransferase
MGYRVPGDTQGSPSSVTPRNETYAGAGYAMLVDPLARPLRDAVADMVPGGSRVIELACGTGDQLLRLAHKIREGVGIDLSDRMLACARRSAQRRGISNIAFELADAADLSRFPDRSFDIAMASLFLHEVPHATALAALAHMKRLAPLIVIADFGGMNLPARVAVNAIELCAGFTHYGSFRAYRRSGGMPSLLGEAGLDGREAARAFRGAVTVWECTRQERDHSRR